MVCLICAYKWMRMYPGTGRFLYVLFFSFSWELGNVLLIKSQSGKGVAQFGDFHEWGFLSCLALNSRFYTSSTGGDYGVTSGYLKDRLDPWGTKGKVLGPTSGGVIPTGYQGRQEKVRAWVRTWSPLHMSHSLLAPRGVSLTTVTCGSAFAPGQREVILSGS